MRHFIKIYGIKSLWRILVKGIFDIRKFNKENDLSESNIKFKIFPSPNIISRYIKWNSVGESKFEFFMDEYENQDRMHIFNPRAFSVNPSNMPITND